MNDRSKKIKHHNASKKFFCKASVYKFLMYRENEISSNFAQ